MALKAGDEIGQYVLQARLGSGGFGSVWKAIRKGSLIAIPVAVTVSHEDLSSEDGGDRAVEQLLAEARAWVSASGHRNVVPVQDAGIWDGHLLLVSELMTEGSLRTYLNRLRSQPMPLKEAVRLTHGILAGLEHLHGLGIIHRDLKPENVLLQKGDPRITDFGIARFATRSTQTRGYSGTLQYMSPDAFENRVSHQMDLWAVGVMLFEMLAGLRPFDGANEAQLIRAILSDRVPPLPRTVPAALQSVVQRALDREVSRRFQSAAQFRQTLEAAWAVSANLARRAAAGSKSSAAVPAAAPNATTAPSPGMGNESPAAEPPALPVSPGQAASPPAKKSPARRRAVLLLGAASLGTVLWSAGLLKGFGRPKNVPTNSSPESTRVNLGGEVVGLASIPAGEFMMGALASDLDAFYNEKPVHRVKVSGFEMGVTEVTVGQFQAYCRATGKEMPKQEDWNNTAQHPVHNVSWDDAVGFCEWATSELKRGGLPGSVRLPTEAEWEYAARGGATGIDGKPLHKYPWGDQAPAGGDGLLNFDGNGDGYEYTAPVGRFKPNGYGLRDMAGNVYEWCQDRYDEGYYAKSPVENPQGSNDTYKRSRVLCGGSWFVNPLYLRASHRLGYEPADRHHDAYGFRLARTLRP